MKDSYDEIKTFVISNKPILRILFHMTKHDVITRAVKTVLSCTNLILYSSDL